MFQSGSSERREAGGGGGEGGGQRMRGLAFVSALPRCTTCRLSTSESDRLGARYGRLEKSAVLSTLQGSKRSARICS
jgi:hypothetical protein